MVKRSEIASTVMLHSLYAWQAIYYSHKWVVCIILIPLLQNLFKKNDLNFGFAFATAQRLFGYVLLELPDSFHTHSLSIFSVTWQIAQSIIGLPEFDKSKF